MDDKFIIIELNKAEGAAITSFNEETVANLAGPSGDGLGSSRLAVLIYHTWWLS